VLPTIMTQAIVPALIPVIIVEYVVGTVDEEIIVYVFA
jgi:hypothetical protein